MKSLSNLWRIIEHIIIIIFQFLLKKVGISWNSSQWEKFMQFVRFCFVGLSSSLIMFCSYSVTYLISKNYYLANIIGFLFSTLNSFIWNKRFVFRNNKSRKSDYIKEYLKTLVSYSFTGLILSNILLYLWIEKVGISGLIAPIINIIIVTPLNFVLNKLWTFKNSDNS